MTLIMTMMTSRSQSHASLSRQATPLRSSLPTSKSYRDVSL